MATGRPSLPVLLSPRARFLPLLVGAVVVLSACAGSSSPTDPARASSFHPDGWDGVVARPSDDLYDPISAGESPPSGFRQLLDRDDIFPVYEPRFVTSDLAGWEPEELIIGVDLEGEARAYPVAFLNRREIVVDLHRGIPTFVTW